MTTTLPTQPTSVKTAKTKKRTFKNCLGACATSLALILPLNVSAQEQTLPMTRDSIASVISTPSEKLIEDGKKKQPDLKVHGSVRAGSNVTPLLGSVLGDNPALRFTIDVSNSKTGIGASLTRFDDFNKSMNNPASKLTMIDLYKNMKLGKKISVTGVGEYVNIDKISGSDSFTPILGCTYDAGKGWIFDARFCYTIQKGKDIPAVRAGVTKTLNEAFSLAAQVIHNEKLSGRFQAKVKLNKNLSMEIGGIADENGNITPIAGVLFGL